MNTPFFLIASPLLASVLLLLFGNRIGRAGLGFLAISGISFSALSAILMLINADAGIPITQELFTWLPQIGNFQAVNFSLALDTLSLTMCTVVTFVSSLIAIYAWEYMSHEEGIGRFFMAMNLFVSFMLLLVMADNLLILFMGWEGVGLCSYILIGFYFKEPNAEKAAMKAFITTRIGDVFLLFGMIICMLLFHTLEISSMVAKATLLFPNGSWLISVAALCFLAGAVGKSAQLPLQTWLADAMWGPTPVSALIHAATMVTAGVYLIARLNGFFALSVVAQDAVLLIGTVTLLFAGIVACFQTDMKKVLAYSTMSQLGYMFLALGVHAYQAAIFHLVTHAFFKALLFLSAGVIGHSLHTYDLRKMGGLRHSSPLLFWLFMVGALNLVGLPFITAGFFSKEWILGQAHHVSWAWYVGVLGAFLTGFYTFRMMILAFWQERKTKQQVHAGSLMLYPLIILAGFSLCLGWLETPANLGGMSKISDWLSVSLPHLPELDESLLLLFTPTLCASLGVALAIGLYGKRALSFRDSSTLTMIKNGGGFDSLYQTLFIRSFVALSHALKNDLVLLADKLLSFIATLVFSLIAQLHTGKLKSYLSFMIVAALVMAGTAVVL